MQQEHRRANRASWDARVPVHAASEFYDVERWLADERGPRTWELEAVGDVSGLRLAHLQCHFGLDTLQWARAGAEVTGLDFSAPALEVARDLATRAGLATRATFVHADVHDATAALGVDRFDVVYVSLGALCWIPRVDAWMEQAAGVLQPGGRLYLHDGHPYQWVSDEVIGEAGSYFEEPEPWCDDVGGTYTDGHLEASGVSYEWNHSIGEIVTAAVRHGLQIDSLTEHPWTVWKAYDWLVPMDEERWVIPPDRAKMPLSFTLLATKR